MNSTNAANKVRLRRECIAEWLAAMAAIAASAAARPGEHPEVVCPLGGVNIRNTSEAKVIPTMRRDGPSAVPGIRFLRISTDADTTRPNSIANTANRLAREPSAEYENSAVYRLISSYQCIDGPRSVSSTTSR